MQLYEDGKIKEAAALLDQICGAYPNNDAAWYYRGLCGISQKDAEMSEICLKKAAELDSSNFWYASLLADFYSMTDRSELTIYMYENLLKANPKKTDLHFTLANLYINQEDYDKAFSTLNNIETQFGKTEGTTITKFNILRVKGKQEEAVKTLEDYCEEYSSPRIQSMLGDYEMGMYEDSSALARYEAALAIDSEYAPALLGKAEIYRMKSNYTGYFQVFGKLVSNRNIPTEPKYNYLMAILRQRDLRFVRSFKPDFDNVISNLTTAHPEDSLALKSAGLYYLAQGEMDKSLESYIKLRDTYPDCLSATTPCLDVYMFKEDWKQMVAECDSAIKRFPDKMILMEYKNTALYNLNDYRGIISNCEKMIAATPGDSAVFVDNMSLIADMYYAIDEEGKAFKSYEAVLKVAPNHIPSLNNYAYYLSKTGKKLKKAYSMSLVTVEAEPDNPTYLDTLGWILYLMGKPNEAKTYFKHAMLYGGKESPTILSHYADVLEALGEDSLAKVYRQQAKDKASEGKE